MQNPLVVLQRLLQQKSIVLARLQLVKDLLVVLLPPTQHFRQCDATCWLLWKDTIRWHISRCWQPFHQTAWETSVGPRCQDDEHRNEANVTLLGHLLDCEFWEASQNGGSQRRLNSIYGTIVAKAAMALHRLCSQMPQLASPSQSLEYPRGAGVAALVPTLFESAHLVQG